ncbi:MAG: hypothetical protein D3925_15585, partial [Candidatus Electrothrix sp. AR5]|nr:hypothetical protein [Candidatus Electrothrix sp. AR5]
MLGLHFRVTELLGQAVRGLYCFLGFDSEFIKLHGSSSLLYILFPLQNKGLLFFIFGKEDKNYLQGVKKGYKIKRALTIIPTLHLNRKKPKKMYRFEAKHDAIPEEERRKLSSFFSHELTGEIALEWSELIRSSIKQDHELIIFKIYCKDSLVGIAILSVIRKLKMTQWRPVAPLFKIFTNFDVGFIEIPLSNMSGLMTKQSIDPDERYKIMNALCGHIRQTVNIDILCIKINQPAETASKSLLCSNMVPLSFYPNTLLKFPYSSFNQYTDSLPRKKYRRCIADKKKLMKEDGDIEIVHDISDCIDEIYALYKKTCKQAKERKNDIEMPVLIDKDFFKTIQTFKALTPRFITIRVHGKIIA